MVGIPENELQSVPAGWKLKAGLGLPCAEVNVLLVGRDRFVRLDRVVHIDQEMVVTRIRSLVARMGDAHVAQPEPHREAAADPLSVTRIDDVQEGVRRGRGLRLSRRRLPGEAQGECGGKRPVSDRRVHE